MGMKASHYPSAPSARAIEIKTIPFATWDTLLEVR